MEIEELVNEILLRTRHPESYHDDERVNERLIRAEVWDLIQDYTDEVEARYRGGL